MLTGGDRFIITHPMGVRGSGLVTFMLLGLVACGGGGDDGAGSGSGSGSGSGGGSGSGSGNAAPTITGSAPGNVQAGSAYSFTPVAQDPENATLTYSIQNKPAWATFSTANGALTGTPTVAQVGSYANIIISVSDGTNTTSLAPFTVTVTQAANGSVQLSWTAPTTNEDGSAVSLAGFRIYYGTSATALNNTLDAPGQATRIFTVTSLVPGTYYFSITAYSPSGIESARSNSVSAVVQ